MRLELFRSASLNVFSDQHEALPELIEDARDTIKQISPRLLNPQFISCSIHLQSKHACMHAWVEGQPHSCLNRAARVAVVVT